MVGCRELRRLRDEGESRFRDRSLLHQRYRMGNLLGKGGFSDVYLVSPLAPSPCRALLPLAHIHSLSRIACCPV